MARIVKRKTKRGISYQATIRRKGFDTVSRTFDTKGEALAWAATTEQDMKDQRYHNPRRAMGITLNQALTKYLSTISKKKAINTQLLEESVSQRLLERIGSATPLGSISPQIVAQYRDARLQEVTAYSVRHELSLLSHLFSKAKKEWGLPVENPVADIERPAPPRGRTRFLTENEAVNLLESCRKSRNYKFYYYILTLLHTGMRSSEAAGLRWEQIDLEKRVIFLPTTKNNDPRWVPLTKELTLELHKLKEMSNGKTGDLVFLNDDQIKNERSKARPGLKFRESFNTAKRRAGLLDIHMHDLRHTAASHLIMSGVDIRTLADILGHRTLQMVQRYTHLLHDHKLSAIDKIGLLGQPQSQEPPVNLVA